MGMFSFFNFEKPQAKKPEKSVFHGGLRPQKLESIEEMDAKGATKIGEEGRGLPSHEIPSEYNENEDWYQDEERLKQRSSFKTAEDISNDEHNKSVEPGGGAIEEDVDNLRKNLERNLSSRLSRIPDNKKGEKIARFEGGRIKKVLDEARESYFRTDEENLDAKIDADLEKERRDAFFRRVEKNKAERAAGKQAGKNIPEIKKDVRTPAETIKKDFNRTVRGLAETKKTADNYSSSEITLMTAAYNWVKSPGQREKNPVLDAKGAPLKPEDILELANDYGEYMVEKGDWGRGEFKLTEYPGGQEKLVCLKKSKSGRFKKYVINTDDDPGSYFFDLSSKTVVRLKNEQKDVIFVKLIPDLLPRQHKSAKLEHKSISMKNQRSGYRDKKEVA